VSLVALLVLAMYWSWLWGLPGLLLATPLTACFKVAGDYIPALGFLSVLLGADRELDDYHDFYRMLLELDSMNARELAIRYCDENGLERTFDDVFIPVLSLAGDATDTASRIIVGVAPAMPGLTASSWRRCWTRSSDAPQRCRASIWPTAAI
jgi:hypothetical protein